MYKRQELGFALFDRSDSNELTETGMVFLDGMERALEVIDSGLELSLIHI